MKKRIKAFLFGLSVTVISCCILLLVIALILGKMQTLPKNAVPIIMTLTACAAVFLGSLSGALYLREMGILLGLLEGTALAVMIFVVSFAFQEKALSAASFGKASAIMISGSIGGILGVNKRGKVKF